MGIKNNINGVWRDLWSSHVKINGVWRDSDVSINVDGVWRKTYTHEISESDILGFRLIYKLASEKNHPDFPNLVVNKTLPVEVHLTGESQRMDFNAKGIIFRYTNDEPDNEGILMYEGTLYAVLLDGRIINVSSSNKLAGSDDRYSSGIPECGEIWVSNRIANMSIQINGRVLYESFGYYMSGWNSLFDSVPFIDPTNFPDKGPHKDVQVLDPRIILPVGAESETFDSFASIGIARNMKTPTNNMIGSHGLLDHSIHHIYANGVAKPFVVEMYG